MRELITLRIWKFNADTNIPLILTVNGVEYKVLPNGEVYDIRLDKKIATLTNLPVWGAGDGASLSLHLERAHTGPNVILMRVESQADPYGVASIEKFHHFLIPSDSTQWVVRIEGIDASQFPSYVFGLVWGPGS